MILKPIFSRIFSSPAAGALAVIFLSLNSLGQEEAQPPATPKVPEESEYNDEVTRDFPLKSLSRLRVTNRRGGIVIRGWSQNKIRVIAKRTTLAQSLEEAQALLSHSGFQYREHGGRIELSAEYGRGLGIEEKLRERNSPKTKMELMIRAPSGLPLEIWSLNENVSVQSWTNNIEVRADSGKVQIESVRADRVSVTCPRCQVFLKGLKSSVRVVGGSQRVDLHAVRGEQTYVETGEGAIDVERVHGKQIYVSHSGRIRGLRLTGRVEFRNGSGEVVIEGSEGFVSGRTESGHIQIGMRDWRFEDRSLIESETGNIHLTLPESFSAEVDLWSVSGGTQLDFPLIPLRRIKTAETKPQNRLRGIIGDGGPEFKVFSQAGSVWVKRRAP